MQINVQNAANAVIGNPNYSISDWINWLTTLAISNNVIHDKDITETLIDFYRGLQLDKLEELIKEQYPKSYKQLTWQMEICNVVKMFIDQTSVIYKFGATRTLTTDSQPEKDLWEWIMRSSKYERKLVDVNKKVNLTENVVVRVWYDTVDEIIKLDILTRDLLDVLPSANDCSEAEGVYYMQPLSVYNDSIRYHYWGVDDYAVFDSKTGKYIAVDKNEGQENPYHILPFTRFTKTFPENGYFVPPPEDLLLIQQSINLKIVELNNMLKFQAFATPVVIGTIDATAGIDPSLPIVIDNSGRDEQPSSFSYANPDADFESLSTEIAEKIRRFAQTRGFSPADFTVTGGYTSGIALEISGRAMTDMLNNEKPFYEDGEEELFSIIKEVWNYHSNFTSPSHPYHGKKFSDSTVLNVLIHEPTISRDGADELPRNQFELDNGFLSSIGYYVRTYGITEEEAKERYENEKKLRAEYPFDVEEAKDKVVVDTDE